MIIKFDYIFAPFVFFFVCFLWGRVKIYIHLYISSDLIDGLILIQLNKKQKINRQLLVKNFDGFP